MRCFACGYEHIPDREETREVYYKVGPKRGKLKGEETVIVKGNTPFIKICPLKGEFYRENESHYYWHDQYSIIDVKACPRCGTMKVVDSTIMES